MVFKSDLKRKKLSVPKLIVTTGNYVQTSVRIGLEHLDPGLVNLNRPLPLQ